MLIAALPRHFRHNLIPHNLMRHNSKLLRTLLLTVLGLYISACSTLPSTASATPEPVIKAPSIALVLGGGGAKGFAHVGVIKMLEENGIKPTLVVGTSVGSLIGSLYASGYTPAQLEQLALTTTDGQLTDFTLSNQGFIEGIKLKNFINTKVGERAIEDFPIAFAAVAAEKHTLKKAVFTTGNAGLAVQASCSVPNIFIAPRIPDKVGKKYIDGGVVSLVPVDSAYDLGADIVIAIDVTVSQGIGHTATQIPTINSLSDFWGFLETNIMATNTTGNRSASTKSERDRADIVITPNVGHISSVDTRQRRNLIQAGSQATAPQIIAIKQLIQEKSNSKYATP
ncbi:MULTISPECIES: patatin-like phospholipase family protein [unclassified Psychrobacter]|uniref:patatin-like phospholipase family protein n=1 Tax=unclassified Psychrobacter TaxID=196806 RepID=UPI0025B4C8C2|nr:MULTISPECIES: patatin-like phospholipase family protein [unclassified Psychrobacter]MDN3453170.1 patatin-like phospholipase family protein [Psychrobacter sp. APC 3350]MDN3503104.1 patatin-like phospholipase family protein [Psychrobacter sp. 5A.1]